MRCAGWPQRRQPVDNRTGELGARGKTYLEPRNCKVRNPVPVGQRVAKKQYAPISFNGNLIADLVNLSN